MTDQAWHIPLKKNLPKYFTLTLNWIFSLFYFFYLSFTQNNPNIMYYNINDNIIIRLIFNFVNTFLFTFLPELFLFFWFKFWLDFLTTSTKFPKLQFNFGDKIIQTSTLFLNLSYASFHINLQWLLNASTTLLYNLNVWNTLCAS